MKQYFQILALSGGRFHGLFAAKVLAGLESRMGVPIDRCFDLICGTSVGSIVAMEFGVGKSEWKIAEVIIHGRWKPFFANHKALFTAKEKTNEH